MLRFAAAVREALAAAGTPAALIARSGTDLSRFGLRYSHAGVALADGLDSEDIDGASITTDGMVMLSTVGAFSVPGAGGTVTGSSQDVLRFSPTTLGQATTGWAGEFQALSALGIDPAKNVGSIEVVVKALSVN